MNPVWLNLQRKAGLSQQEDEHRKPGQECKQSGGVKAGFSQQEDEHRKPGQECKQSGSVKARQSHQQV